MLTISARLKEKAELEGEENSCLQEWVSRTGIIRLARAAYSITGSDSFFTVGEDEVKAWTIPEDCQPARRRKDSFGPERVIRAEVVDFNDLYTYGSMAWLEKKGFSPEGKDYPVKDGEIVHFV